MLQKEAVEPHTLQLLEAIQADSMFAQFHLADLADWPVLINNKKLTWNKIKTTINNQCEKHLKSL